VDISNEFSKISVKTHNCTEGLRYLDPSRKNFLVITPEEEVRQKMIVYLKDKLLVPVSNIYSEDHLIHYGINDVNGRIDISLISDNERPIAVIECKEPKIPVIGIQVYEQAVRYASAISAPYIILVNGREIFFSM